MGDEGRLRGGDIRRLERLVSHKVLQRPVDQRPNDSTWVEEKECIVLLLKARMMLRDIVEGRLKQGTLEPAKLSLS